MKVLLLDPSYGLQHMIWVTTSHTRYTRFSYTYNKKLFNTFNNRGT